MAKFVFRLSLYIFNLKLYIFNLQLCVFSLKTDFSFDLADYLHDDGIGADDWRGGAGEPCWTEKGLSCRAQMRTFVSMMGSVAACRIF
ncbi:MAG TPA: hypothetical protein IAA99_06465 [Candidatus Avibacteroides faecavium]|nr:hypothetical protein [Candidatus Avibacteroides faecavium]